MNQLLTLSDRYNEIDLVNKTKPVITLYDAQFLKSNLNATLKGYVL